MKVLKAFLFCFMCVFLISCEPSAVREGREMYKAYFKKKLKDPDSFVVYSEKYVVDGVRVEWTLDYGAKNSYGGMIRNEKQFITIGYYIKIDDWSYEMKDLQ